MNRLSVRVHPRVNQKRPSITDQDAIKVFNNPITSQRRARTDPPKSVGVGVDGKGRKLEWIAVDEGDGKWLIYHCAPVTQSILRELGLIKGKGKRR